MASYQQPPDELTDLIRVGENKAEKLRQDGYDLMTLRKATKDEIKEVDGIGNSVAHMIVTQLDPSKAWP